MLNNLLRNKEAKANETIFSYLGVRSPLAKEKEMKCILIFILLLFLSSIAFCDEAAIPAFSKKPLIFKWQHEITKTDKAIDELQLGDITESDLKFWFLFIRTNYHICSMSGIAESSGVNTYEYSRGDCRLKITVEPKQATVEDIGGKCSHSELDEDITSCGSRGYIGKTTLGLVLK